MSEASAAYATAGQLESDVVAAVKAAAYAADEVDRDARFPIEAIEGIKDAGLLSCSLPTELGGRSYTISQLATIARALGGACSSAGMVFAMHHIQALALAHHGGSGPIADVTAEIAATEALLASATTESTTGGDIGSSTCAVLENGDDVVLEKNASVISYAEQADYILATARRTPEGPPGDQVLVLCPAVDTELEKTSDWNVMGFRGTCSPGYALRTRTARRNVLPVGYGEILSTSMLPASHTLWAAVWLGMADSALAKARTATRSAVRKAGGGLPVQSGKLADLTLLHQNFETAVLQHVRTYQDFLQGTRTDPPIGFTISMNNLKIFASTTVVDIATGALSLIGMNGYREDHPLSMSRLLRDSFAPQLMVSNDRIRTNNAQLALAHRGPRSFT